MSDTQRNIYYRRHGALFALVDGLMVTDHEIGTVCDNGDGSAYVVVDGSRQDYKYDLHTDAWYETL